MIVVAANCWDSTARDFAARWPAHNMRLLTARDLSQTGWQQSVSRRAIQTAIVEGAQVSQDEITGVLTRLPCVFEQELFDIAPEDREYVAAEMNALLQFWLSSLDCPVLNRPTAGSIAGPSWRAENWVRAAMEAEIPVEPIHRCAALGRCAGHEEETNCAPVTVIVVGERSFGEADSVLHQRARRLAKISGTDLLGVKFSGPERAARFVRADIFPELTGDDVGQAVLEYFGSR